MTMDMGVVSNYFDCEPPGRPLENARQFLGAEYDHDEYRLLVHQGGEWYRWDGTCWVVLEELSLRAQLYRHFARGRYLGDNGIPKSFDPTQSKIANIVDALRAAAHLPVATASPSWISGAPYAPADELVACLNGLVHYPTRTVHPHSPRFYVHHSVQFAFDTSAPKPSRWLAFLEQLWGGDLESISTLQEYFGYLISADTRMQKILLVVGPRRAGKGTIIRVLEAMLGKHNVVAPTLASFGTNFGLQPLIGKPVAVIFDARLGSNSASNSAVTERLLSISGEDMLSIDRKYREHWTGQLPTRIIVLTNELPRFSDSSGALASRFIVLQLTKSFYGRENPNLTAELCTELPGIFCWALDGLERLRVRGRFVQPASSADAIRQLEDLSSPISVFLRDRCAFGTGLAVPRNEFYQAWRAWCEEHGRRPTSMETFGRDLRATRPEIQDTRPRDGERRRRLYAGVGLVQAVHGPDHCGSYAPADGPDGDTHSSGPRTTWTEERLPVPNTDSGDSDAAWELEL